MKRRNIAIMAMLALTAGQAFAQRCLPQMKGIEVKVGMADGVYNGKKSCKAGYYAGLGLSSYTKGGDKWIYGAEYLQVHQPYRETSAPRLMKESARRAQSSSLEIAEPQPFLYKESGGTNFHRSALMDFMSLQPFVAL